MDSSPLYPELGFSKEFVVKATVETMASLMLQQKADNLPA